MPYADKNQKGLTSAWETAAPVRKTATATLGLQERNVIIEDDNITLTLPPVAEAAGMQILFENEGGGNLTVVDGGDAGLAISDTSCQTAKDLLIFQSTGRFWFVVFST